MKKLWIVILLILGISAFGLHINAQNTMTDESNKDLLIIVEENAIYDLSLVDIDVTISYDIVEVQDILLCNMDDYREVAAPYSMNNFLSQILIEQYNENKKIYLYGEFTIAQFCQVLDLDMYSVEMPIKQNNDIDTVTMSFRDEYVENEIQNVVALQKNTSDGMLATIPKNEFNEYDLNLFIKAIVDDVKEETILPRATIVSNNYNIKVYDSHQNYAILDWILYQEVENDNNTTSDYFAIRTNVMLKSTGYNETDIFVNMELPFSTDNYIDSSPGDSTRTTTFNVGLNFGDSISGGASWSFTMDNAPTIDRSVDTEADRVEWSCEEFFYTLDGEVFSPGMSWSSRGTYAAVDLEFQGRFYDLVNRQYSYTEWGNVAVRFDY